MDRGDVRRPSRSPCSNSPSPLDPEEFRRVGSPHRECDPLVLRWYSLPARSFISGGLTSPSLFKRRVHRRFTDR